MFTKRNTVHALGDEFAVLLFRPLIFAEFRPGERVAAAATDTIDYHGFVDVVYPDERNADESRVYDWAAECRGTIARASRRR